MDSETGISARECATVVMEVSWMATAQMRASVRRRRTGGLSVPQLRTLGFVQRNRGASLSAVAEMLGLTLSAASKLVDGLVERKLVTREASPTDRRFLVLCLTESGAELLAEARETSLAELEELLQAMDPAERARLAEALHQLRDVLSAVRPPDPNP